MKFAQREVMDIMVFDKDESLVVNLDSLKNTYLNFNNGECFIETEDALLDTKLIEYLNKVEKENLTDYEKVLNGNRKRKTVIFSNKERTKECKVIARTIARNETDEDIVWTFEFPNVSLHNNLFLKCSGQGEPATFPYKLIVEPYNEEGEMFKLHIEEDQKRHVNHGGVVKFTNNTINISNKQDIRNLANDIKEQLEKAYKKPEMNK